MTVKDEARDPWSYVVAGFTGGLAWAVVAASTVAGSVALPLGVGVGAAVLGAKLLGGAFVRPDGPARYKERRLRVQNNTQEAGWLDRAAAARRAFTEVAESVPPGPIAERVRSFGAATEASTKSLERLAGQASAVRAAMARINPARLAEEQQRLVTAAEQSADPAVRAERERALASVRGQLDAYGRLSAALTALLARLESGAIGLEGLVARLAEVVALAETTGTSADGISEVDSLATELDGLRAGLVEAEDVSARVIGGLAPLPTGSVQQRRRSTE